MAAQPDNMFDAVELMKRGLMDTIKDQLENEIVSVYVESFEQSVRQKVRAELERITLERIEAFKDMIDLRDELKVHLKIEEVL